MSAIRTEDFTGPSTHISKEVNRLDQTGCEWLLSGIQWLSTGCDISAVTTSALPPPPLQVDATYSANPDLSGKRERKKNHTHTRGKKKYLQDVLNVADKTHGVKTTCKWEVCRLLLFSSSSLFLLSFFKFANKLYRAAAV